MSGQLAMGVAYVMIVGLLIAAFTLAIIGASAALWRHRFKKMDTQPHHEAQRAKEDADELYARILMHTRGTS